MFRHKKRNPEPEAGLGPSQGYRGGRGVAPTLQPPLPSLLASHCAALEPSALSAHGALAHVNLPLRNVASKSFLAPDSLAPTATHQAILLGPLPKATGTTATLPAEPLSPDFFSGLLTGLQSSPNIPGHSLPCSEPCTSSPLQSRLKPKPLKRPHMIRPPPPHHSST